MKRHFWRRICALLMSITGILLFAVSCAMVNNQQEQETATDAETATQVLSESGLAEYEIETYLDSFREFFSPEEYLNIYEIAKSKSANPKLCVTNFLFVAELDLSTYNTRDTKGVLMDTTGNIVRECNLFFDVPVALGDFVFLKTSDNPATFDILNSSGETISTFVSELHESYSTLRPLLELNDGYALFTLHKTNDEFIRALFIIQPSGDCYKVHWPDLYKEPSLPESDVEGGYLFVGNASEGLIAILDKHATLRLPNSDYRCGSCAFYCDIKGDLAIDLSTAAVNYEVYRMTDFSNGMADIKFIGADNKVYSATIDKNGDFVSGPTRTVDE